MATIDTITTILNDNLDIEPEKVTEDATFESLGIDSLDMAELTCTLEEAEENGIDKKASGGVKPSKFTDKLKEEQLPEEETKPDNNSGSGDNSKGSSGGVLDSLPVESGLSLIHI